MTAATLHVDRVYGGDFAELRRNPGALVTALLGTLVVGGLGSLLMLAMNRDCVQTFEGSWVAQSREVYNDEFKAAVAAECGADAEGKCRQQLRSSWAKDGQNFHSLEYGLAVSQACPAQTRQDEFEIDFEPGALTKLGGEAEVTDVSEQDVAEDVSAEQPPVVETTTVDDTADPAQVSEPTVKKPPSQEPTERTPSKIPIKPASSVEDRPIQRTPRGDRFGDLGGWSELRKEGDPWATAIMKALNKLTVGAYAGRGEQGTFKFQLTVCKDGKISRVNKKGGSLPPGGQSAVLLALEQLRLPRPPASVTTRMKKRCAKIKYTFVYRNGGVQ